HLIGTAIEANRTIDVHGHIENESELNFLIGMFVEADIITESTSEKALPETAVVALEGGYIVLKLEEETNEGYYFEQISVKVGGTYEGSTALTFLGGLGVTDIVLTTGAFNLIADE
ncbi:efflux transporter periplasmic adaptor subunit, partial [Flavobacteriaceae bacterium]|nr:efflux transporter periplasmic adaptor subunit [Flavobacteriaceae bacterium]